ncbi:RNA-binding protein, containing PUA domain [Methanococcus maripaludis C5]|uniref:RNA-binding protein, containing PUA domain n=1 Tax=Methanococcus maripaludis (strain C5 / ATCC BAA-1333) TaxID=402880 RepID=A4G0D5_METM5|nr:RNA-binding protein [Methanococcus maripaludis]ABO35919.1 RNA-binding protein, containing PUA domain [Methanococcus maripaludis C5]
MEIKRRYMLKKKELKELKDELGNIFDVEKIIPKKAVVEKAVTEEGEIILLDGTPLAMVNNGRIFPTLKFLLNMDIENNKVTVDMGAVKFIANGADVMAPGIVEADENIQEGDIVFVVDVTHKKPLSVGEALMGGKTMVEEKKGKAIKTIHFIGDEIWKM